VKTALTDCPAAGDWLTIASPVFRVETDFLHECSRALFETLQARQRLCRIASPHRA